MALAFLPPTAPSVPTAVNVRHPGFMLFRHYQPWQAGVNVFLLDDGTVTQSEPYGLDGVARTFHGGHIHPVDELEAAALTAAGYELVTVPDPVVNLGLPGGDYTSPPVADAPLLDVYANNYSDFYGEREILAEVLLDSYEDNYSDVYGGSSPGVLLDTYEDTYTLTYGPPGDPDTGVYLNTYAEAY